MWMAAHGIDAASAFVVLPLFAVPALMAWRWHLVGGVLLIALAGFNLYLITVSLISRDPYAYFELDPSFVARAILPVWTAMFIGGFLHVIVCWWEERQSKRASS